MIKDNVIPTLCDHNKDKQPIKRRSTLSRNEIAQKKQYCEEAFELYDKFEKEDTEMYASQNEMRVYSDEYLRDNE